MPVFAQTCRRGPSEVRAQDQISENIRRSGPGLDYSEDADSDYSKKPNPNLQQAVESAKKLRQLQTSNIDKYLAATGKSGRHGYAGTNRTITVGTTNVTKTGYITDKGLFKPWSNESMYNSAGKYGCPVIAQGTALKSLTGYTYPTSNSNLYIGAAITQPSGPTEAAPAIFVGSDMTRGVSGELLPACGNEGVNVQVVYPGKATGFKYIGTYNIGPVSSTGYELQKDIEDVTFQKCMERAEDKGMSLFSYTGDKCYINTNSLSDAMSAGLGIQLNPADKSSLPRDYPDGHQLLHFGKDGTLNVLNSKTPTNSQANIVYKFGLDTAIPQCDFKEGGVIMKIGGSWGLNCNDIKKYYTQEELLTTNYPSSIHHVYDLQNIIKNKQATKIRQEVIPEGRVSAKEYCDAVMGRGCGKNDGTFEEWIRRGGSCPRHYEPWNACNSGCSFLSFHNSWKCK